jgi:hypothetical protein
MMAYNFSLTGCVDSSNATIHISGEWEKPREAGARDVAKLESSYFKSKSFHRKSNKTLFSQGPQRREKRIENWFDHRNNQ